MELKQKKGELLEKEKVIEAITKIITIAKSKLLSILAKLAPILMGIGSIKKIKSILEKEKNAVLNELSRLKNVSIHLIYIRHT